MQKTIHVKNIEKYHPGYKDRHLIWCKTYFSMLDGDNEFEMLEEIDKWRFVSFTILELKLKKPIPHDEKYLTRKGFDFKKKSLEKTLVSLSPFIDVCNSSVTESSDLCNSSVTQNRIDKNRLEYNIYSRFFDEIWSKYPNKDGKKDAIRHFNATVKSDKDVEDIRKALRNYLASNRVKDGFIKNGSTWFNNWRDWITNPVDNKPKSETEKSIENMRRLGLIS